MSGFHARERLEFNAVYPLYVLPILVNVLLIVMPVYMMVNVFSSSDRVFQLRWYFKVKPSLPATF